MKLSIIIPIYNKQQDLDLCINSILSQSFSGFELLLIDDGSNDKSGEICDEYAKKDSRVKVFHKENGGVSSARNLGIENSTGDYISFVDPDDYVETDYVIQLVENMHDVDLLLFGNRTMYSDGGINTYTREKKTIEGKLEFENYYLNLKRDNKQLWDIFGYVWNKCYKKDIIEKYNIRFVPGLSWREDNIFNDQYNLHVQKMKVIDDILYNYRFSATGLTYKIVTQQEYLTLARNISNISKGIINSSLREFEIKRAFDFYLRASLPICSTPVKIFEEIRGFVLNNTSLKLNKWQRISFKGKYQLSFLYYYFVKFGIHRPTISK